MRLIDADNAWGIGILQDWYIHSVSSDDIPQWTDEHIEELCNDFYVIPKKTIKYDINCNLDRLKELAEADKESRCVVLPCKVGDTYYTIQKTCSDGGYAKKGEYFPSGSDCEYCDARDCDKELTILEHKFNSLSFIVDHMEYIGKSLFLTKEEAEGVLEEFAVTC